MILVALYFLGPIVFFLFLRSLRRGGLRNAVLMIAAIILAFLWTAYATSMQPFTGDGRQDVYGLFGLIFWTVATVAGLVRARSRKKRADRLLAWGLGIALVILLVLPIVALYFG